ncbi:hypothetical protein ASPWEDRAFT_114453 [Aspergillus wentii DTO 134E9]|uniref:ASST-domain-containing protein n=1 Tax=Aspergillus wentii DTO 134E9 TaxID=1073089 RepID=A0A1L9RD31_ASPWE|nr:uncharacterized protein ASPWEDRAFT_114453 [Aspergillus wentii DTO 134E9]KAI9933099.1 hypothetical protein MW887_007570 [Aspergillus wentii]OJJ32824.1 hypothetical protein ASPWEDRAFT_114453 [Aspergillus wentii DTO 134E9]
MYGRLLSIFLAAALVPASRGDFGPYFQSELYETGAFGSWPHETFRSTPVLGLSVNYFEHHPFCDDGQYTFLTPRQGGTWNPGPVILDQNGHLVWTAYPYFGPTYNLNVYQFKGKDYLTLWTGKDDVAGHGEGLYYMLDSSYEKAYTISAANGHVADLNDFLITLEGTALFTVYDSKPIDLRAVDGVENGWIWDSLIQEVDIETGALLFEWRASDHLSLNEVVRPREDTGDEPARPWDAFHISSVDKDLRGNYLVSLRYTNSLVYIDWRTGNVIWKLGGKENMFTDLSGGTATNINWQNHARFADGGNAITLFDNASRGPGDAQNPSRGLYLGIDEGQMTVWVRNTYWSPRGISSQEHGSMQVLDSGNVLIGYGSAAAWTEFNGEGSVLCDVHFGPELNFNTGNLLSSRVFKQHWVGLPKTRPNIGLSGYEAAVSWNGATEIATWVLQGSDQEYVNIDGDDASTKNNKKYVFLASVPKSGFETIISIPTDAMSRYIRALALDSEGHVLGSSRLLEWNAAEEIAVTKPVEVPSQYDFRPLIFFIVGFATATALGIAIWAARCCIAARTKRRGVDRDRGRWGLVDFNGDEEGLSDDELGHGGEFSLLNKPPGGASASNSHDQDGYYSQDER